MLHAAVLRSPRPHAKIKSIDTRAAAALPGVVKVLTGADIAATTGALPCFANPPVEQRCVATDRVRHVGEAVAVAIAESRYIAEDALERIDVQGEDLPTVVDPEQATRSTGDAVLHPGRGPSNVAIQRHFVFGNAQEDFATAAKIIKRRLRWPRSGAQPLETVGAVSEYHSGSGKFTIHANTSMYNYVGWTMALSLGIPAHRTQRRAGDRGYVAVSAASCSRTRSACWLPRSPVFADGRSNTSRTADRQHHGMRQSRLGPDL